MLQNDLPLFLTPHSAVTKATKKQRKSWYGDKIEGRNTIREESRDMKKSTFKERDELKQKGDKVQ